MQILARSLSTLNDRMTLVNRRRFRVENVPIHGHSEHSSTLRIFALTLGSSHLYWQ